MKKGELSLTLLMELVVVVAIGYLLIDYASSLAGSERVEKANIAEDFRMAIDLLIATPGDAKIRYPADLSNYKINLAHGVVVVSSGNELTEATKTSRVFFQPSSFFVGGMSENNQSVYLIKEDKRITLSGE